MEAVRRIEGTAVPLDRSDVDTDQIVPARFLKRIERTGFGVPLRGVATGPRVRVERRAVRGRDDPAGGRQLRQRIQPEHAPWALEDHGFKAVIAPSFADIFRNNCCKIGLLPVELPEESVRALMDAVLDDPRRRSSSTSRALGDPPSVQETFAFDDFRRWCLLEGYDDIDLTLRHVGRSVPSRRGVRPGCRRRSEPISRSRGSGGVRPRRSAPSGRRAPRTGAPRRARGA